MSVAAALAIGAGSSVAQAPASRTRPHARRSRPPRAPRGRDGAHRSFVTCPIVRDTKTVPCWLAEHDGELYYLGIQTDISADFDPPYLGHRVLVEGVVKDAAAHLRRRRAGARERLAAARARRDVQHDSARRGPLSGAVRAAARRGRAAGGSRSIRRPGAARSAPPEREGPQEFALEYDFDMAVMGRHSGVLTQIFNYARKVDARRIEIMGRRGAALLSNGTTLTERAELAELRAREVAKLLAGAGLDAAAFEVAWSSEVETARRRRRLAHAPHARPRRALSGAGRRYSCRSLPLP